MATKKEAVEPEPEVVEPDNSEGTGSGPGELEASTQAVEADTTEKVDDPDVYEVVMVAGSRGTMNDVTYPDHIQAPPQPVEPVED